MPDNNRPSSPCPLGEDNCPIIEEIGELKQQVETLNNEIRIDHLTGLFNRRHLMFVLEQEIERTQRTNQPTTILMLDVDHFKKFNDSYGHIAGDRVLTHLASILKASLRKLDIPCRYGGEEFAVILPSTPIFIGSQVAERVRQSLESSPINHEGHTLNITISIGVDTLPNAPACTPQELLDRADKQLYRAKEEGRNRVATANGERDKHTSLNADERNALFDD